jgi:hypothetical protein
MLGKTFDTAAGVIKIVTFDDFIQAVPTRYIGGDDLYYFDAQVNFNQNNYESIYQKSAIALVRGYKKEIFKSNIVLQTALKHQYKRDLKETLEDAVLNSLCNYGLPSHLVRLGRRTWLLANPEDFNILTNSRGGIGMACYKRQRNVVYFVDRRSEQEVLDTICRQFPELNREKVIKQLRGNS